MGLAIEDAALEAKARRLAKLTGTSIAGAVKEAVERRLAEIEDAREAEVRRRSRRRLELGRAVAATLPPRPLVPSTVHHDPFRDDDVLPK